MANNSEYSKRMGAAIAGDEESWSRQLTLTWLELGRDLFGELLGTINASLDEHYKDSNENMPKLNQQVDNAVAMVKYAVETHAHNVLNQDGSGVSSTGSDGFEIPSLFCITLDKIANWQYLENIPENTITVSSEPLQLGFQWDDNLKPYGGLFYTDSIDNIKNNGDQATWRNNCTNGLDLISDTIIENNTTLSELESKHLFADSLETLTEYCKKIVKVNYNHQQIADLETHLKGEKDGKNVIDWITRITTPFINTAVTRYTYRQGDPGYVAARINLLTSYSRQEKVNWFELELGKAMANIKEGYKKELSADEKLEILKALDGCNKALMDEILPNSRIEGLKLLDGLDIAQVITLPIGSKSNILYLLDKIGKPARQVLPKIRTQLIQLQTDVFPVGGPDDIYGVTKANSDSNLNDVPV